MPYRQLIFCAECGSLADGHERLPRHPGEECHCPEGWGGVNCNGQLEDFRALRGGIYSSLFAVCLADQACTNFPLPNKPTDDDGSQVNMVCYKGGDAVREAHQMCKVTSVSGRYLSVRISHKSTKTRGS
jgi:hypothetical protein